MRNLLTIGTILGVLCSPAVADPFDTGDSYGPRNPSAETSGDTATRQQIEAINRHDREAYEALVQNGGCDAPTVPFTYAVACGRVTSDGVPHYKHVFGGEQNGQIGSTGD